MTSKERVLNSINHQEPDKVPKFASFTPEFAKKLREYFNIEGGLFNPHGGEEHDLDMKLGNDMLLISHGFGNSYYQSLNNDYVDEWGIGWKIVEYNTAKGKGKYTEISNHPLENDEAINSYIAPDPTEEDRYITSKKVIKNYGRTHAIMGVIACTIFEAAWALRGLDKMMMDLVTNEEFANKVLDIPFNYHLYAGKKLVELGADIIWTGDDVGSQNQMMLSPELWRKYFKPRMYKMFSEFKAINPSIKIAYHSDGNIYPIIDDLVEIGLDILNPIQPKSMDPYYLKKRYGNALSFWGTIDIQETLPFGTKEDIENEVKERIKHLAPGGGFIISPTHFIQIDTSIENFFTFWNAIDKYGEYPINNL